MLGTIIIDSEGCKGCGLCVVVCPKQCIVMSTTSNKTGFFPARSNNNDCTGCTACAIICPEAVIEVARDSNIVEIKTAQKKTAVQPIKEKT